MKTTARLINAGQVKPGDRIHGSEVTNVMPNAVGGVDVFLVGRDEPIPYDSKTATVTVERPVVVTPQVKALPGVTPLGLPEKRSPRRHRSSDGSLMDGRPRRSCGCQSCRDKFGPPREVCTSCKDAAKTPAPVPLAVPALHLNGTGKLGLQEPIDRALQALGDVEENLRQSAPHMRDYYVQPEGEAVFRRAVEQHATRMAAVRKLEDELVELYTAIEHHRT